MSKTKRTVPRDIFEAPDSLSLTDVLGGDLDANDVMQELGLAEDPMAAAEEDDNNGGTRAKKRRPRTKSGVQQTPLSIDDWATPRRMGSQGVSSGSCPGSESTAEAAPKKKRSRSKLAGSEEADDDNGGDVSGDATYVPRISVAAPLSVPVRTRNAKQRKASEPLVIDLDSDGEGESKGQRQLDGDGDGGDTDEESKGSPNASAHDEGAMPESYWAGLSVLESTGSLLSQLSEMTSVEDAPESSQPTCQTTVIVAVTVPGKPKPYEFKLMKKDPFTKISMWIEKVLFFKSGSFALKWHGIPLPPEKTPADFAMDDRESVDLSFVVPDSSGPSTSQSTLSSPPKSSSSSSPPPPSSSSPPLPYLEAAALQQDGKIFVKVQWGEKHDQVRKFRIAVADAVLKLLDGFAQVMKLDSSDVKLLFDGEVLDTARTLEDYGIEDDDMIDAKITRRK